MKYWLVKYRYKDLDSNEWSHYNELVQGSVVEFLCDLNEQLKVECVIDFALEIEESEYNCKSWCD